MVLISSPYAERIWRGTALALLFLSVVTGAIDLFDDRPIGGADFWSRLLNFELAMAVHFITLAAVVQCLNGEWRGRFPLTLLAVVSAACVVGETGWIIWLAVHHEQSVFALSPTILRFVYGVMGAGATAAMASAFVVGVLAAFDRKARMMPALRLGIVLGLAGGAVLSMAVGLELGRHGPSHVGVHPVDGPVVPFAGWSLVVGDLRVPYFFARHSIQFLPIVGWLAALLFPRGIGLLTVAAVSAAYAAFTGWALQRALAGLPVF